MGVVIKQSFWGSAFAYVGVIIGYITTLYLRPKYLSFDQIGLLSLVISNALLIAPFTVLGMPGTLVKFFPYLDEDESLRKRFLSLQLVVVLLANILFIVFIISKLDWVKSYFASESALYNEYILISLIIVISHSLFLFLQAYSSIKLDIIIPGILKDVFLRLGNGLIILAYGFEIIDFDWTVYSLAFTYTVALLIQAYFNIVKQDFRISFSSIKVPAYWRKEILKYGSFTFTLGAGSAFSSYMGNVLVSGNLGLEANGIFTITFFIGLIIELPKRSVMQIIAPIISKAIKEDKMEHINSLYKRSSLTLTTIGLLFFLGIVCNVNDLFLLIPQGELLSQGFLVVVIIAISKIIDMTFGFNGGILVYSNHYKYNAYFLVISIIVLYVLDIWLIPIYGINGAAVGYLGSTLTLNLLKHFYILRNLHLSPFTIKHGYLAGVTIILLVGFYYLNIFSSPLLDIIVRSILISVIYLFLIYVLKISDDLNALINANLKKYFNIHIR